MSGEKDEFESLFEEQTEEKVEEQPKEEQAKKPRQPRKPKKIPSIEELLQKEIDESDLTKIPEKYKKLLIEKTPSGTKIMAAYELMCDNSIRDNKVTMNRALIYNLIKLDPILVEEEKKRKK